MNLNTRGFLKMILTVKKLISYKICQIVEYDFKMNIIKWKLNFVSCNFGLKSNLWLQITLSLRARAILYSLV